MEKLTFILFIILFYSFHLSAQNINTKNNGVYLELGGNGLLCSLNYEREIVNNLNVRIGLSVLPEAGSSMPGSPNDILFSPLVMINYLFRFSNESSSGFDVGVGILHMGEAHVFPSFSIGYRYSPIDGGIIFQVAVTPINLQGQLNLWGGVAFGYRF